MKIVSGLSRAVSFLVLFAMLGWHEPAKAQAEANLPPRADTQSATGVSFKSGAFNIGGIVDLSIGGGGISGLQFVRSYSSTNNSSLASLTSAQGWTFNTSASIVRNIYSYPPDETPPPPHLVPLIYTVMTGTKTSRFRGGTVNSTIPVTSYIPYSNNGESLVFTKIGTGDPSSGSYHTFTDADGAVYVYPWSNKKLQSVTYPDGTKLDFSYSPKIVVISNRGYALLWESVNKVCVINLAEHYVTAATSTCPASAQSVAYAYSGTFPNMTSATDALGQATTYSYVGVNHLGCIKDPGQTVCRISNVYSVCPPPPGGQLPANRMLDQVTSQLTGTGESYSYSYDYYGADPCNDYTGYGATATMLSPGGASTLVYTNGGGSVGAVQDPLNRMTGFGYSDGTGNDNEAIMPQSYAAPEQNSQVLTRDSRGNITQARLIAKPGSGLADLVTTASFPATCTNRKTCNKPDYVIDARGNRTDYTYDSNHGGVLTETRPAAPNGIRPQKRFSYTQLYAWIKNSGGSFVQASSAVWMLTGTSECMTMASCPGSADEIKTTYTYGASGVANNLLPTVVTVSAGNNSVSATTTTTYDFAGNILTIDGPLAGSTDTTRTRYDALRRVVGVVSADPDGAGVLLHRAIRNTYDSSGSLVKVERGTVNSQSDGDWAAFVSLEAVDTVYDIVGRKTKETKSGGGTTFAVTQYSYDASGRLDCTAVRMDPAQWSSQSNACVPQTTGPQGSDRISRNIYNIAGERTKLKLGVGTSVEADEETSAFTNNGKLSTITDGEGNKTTYTFDGHDRLSKTNLPDPNTDGVSSPTDYEQFTYDANGNTTQRRLRDGQLINLTYDNLNRLRTKDLPAPEVDVSYNEYDLQGHLTWVTQGTSLSTSFNALGHQLVEVSPVGTMTYYYDPAGRRTLTMWPDGFYVSQDYFVTGEVQAIREFGASSGVGVLATYTLDNRGNRVGVVRGNGATTTIVPDAISRLSSLAHDLAGTAHDIASTFSYNSANQLVTTSRDNDLYAWGSHYNTNRTYSINGLNQVTTAGTTAIGYDGRGNLTSFGSALYSYTAENRLVSGPGGVTLKYDPAGRLSEVNSAQTTRFQYDGTDLITEYDSSNVVLRRYVHGPGLDEPLVWYEGNWTFDRRFYHQDERGSVIAASYSLGAHTRNTFDEYGVPGSTNWGRYQYTGQTWLTELGLYYYKARMYSPTLGRFMQTDPVGYDDGINWYSYAGDDPLNRTDPTGAVVEVVGSPANQQAFADAMAYLSKDKESVKDYARLQKSKHTYKVYVSQKNRTLYNPKTRNLSWNPAGGARVKDGVQSPALGLKHEMDHAANQDSTGKAISLTTDGVTATPEGGREELRALREESKSAVALGEPKRSSPGEGTVETVPNVTSSCVNSGSSGACTPQ